MWIGWGSQWLCGCWTLVIAYFLWQNTGYGYKRSFCISSSVLDRWKHKRKLLLIAMILLDEEFSYFSFQFSILYANYDPCRTNKFLWLLCMKKPQTCSSLAIETLWRTVTASSEGNPCTTWHPCIFHWCLGLLQEVLQSVDGCGNAFKRLDM